MSSHKVLILKKSNKTKIPDDIYQGSTRKVGATITRRGGKINTGLSNDEVKKYLPDIVQLAHTDNKFNKEVQDFYANLVINVPAELEIGLDEDGEPIELFDYIKYRFAQINPTVAASKKEADSSARTDVLYYFQDPDGEKKKAKANLDLEKEAMKAYLKISDDVEKMTQVLQAAGADTRHMSADDVDLALSGLVKTDPTKVLEITKDKNLEFKAFIQNCISADVLRKVGSSILDGDETLGSTLEEAVLYLRDKANSELLATLKARLKAYKV
jgi:hypothetical protein